MAWGLVELDQLTHEQFKTMRKNVRKELREHRIRLVAQTASHYGLIMHRKKSGHSVRTQLGYGTLQYCCEVAVKMLDHTNPGE